VQDPFLAPLIQHLSQVAGVAAIALGGSRARGVAHAASDYDLGLYFAPDPPLDVAGLNAALAGLTEAPAAATPVGAWGPRIVGGAWLRIGGVKVDLLYRPLREVRAVIEECRQGRFRMDYQPGHPHGFCSAIWMGEVALCRPLHDPLSALADLKALTQPYPEPLRAALLQTFVWEIGFSLDNAALALPQRDLTHIAGCLYRSLGCLGQALFAAERRYLINEKRALAEAPGFACAPPDLTARIAALWAAFAAGDPEGAITLGRALYADVATVS
jgi:hypothetical protein